MPDQKLPSPIQLLEDDPILEEYGISLFVKRDDLVGGPCQGNKFRKLAPHLRKLRHEGYKAMLTFGGAFSNHLYAVAAAGHAENIRTIGIVRGEIDEKNPTVIKIRQWGMALHPLDRKTYRKKDSVTFRSELHTRFQETYIIPQGGHHPLAIEGIGTIVDEVRVQLPATAIDFWVCPFATGSTAIGIAKKLHQEESLISCSVLKGLNTEKETTIIKKEYQIDVKNFHLLDASYGGFGKQSNLVESFIVEFYERHQIFLDPIYSGRVMTFLYQMISNNQVNPGSKILFVHTGGYQGILGYNYRFGTDLPTPLSI